MCEAAASGILSSPQNRSRAWDDRHILKFLETHSMPAAEDGTHRRALSDNLEQGIGLVKDF